MSFNVWLLLAKVMGSGVGPLHGLPSHAFLSLHPQVGHIPTTKSSIIRKNGLLLLILPTFVEYLLGADNVLCASPTFDAHKSSMIPVLVLS